MKSISKICLALILVCAITFPAIAQEKKPVEPLKPEKTPVPVGAPAPDLTIDKIYLSKDCQAAVVVKNLGPGLVPDEVWTERHPKSAGVYFYINGRGWGGASIWLFDPTKNLQRPGGTATYTSNLRVTGTATIKAVVDLWNVVREVNEGNNSLETKLACEAQTGPCYIGGRYKGIAVDSPTCPVGPETGPFILILNQTGSSIEGDIIDPATGAVTSKFKGRVTPSGKYCKIVGRSKGVPGGPDEKCIHDFKATLYKNRLGKWETVDGVYTDLSGLCCSGTFRMQQE
jgi:hypothetical protein